MIRTMPHPGFPTDVQAQMMALTTIADGTSVFIENIFESRYKHIGELLRFGAKIHAEGRMAVVEGVKTLNGANVKATDLRGGSGGLRQTEFRRRQRYDGEQSQQRQRL